MNQDINFLPESFLDRSVRRQWRDRKLLATVIMIGLLVSWATVNLAWNRSLRSEAASTAERIESQIQLVNDRQQLVNQRDALLKQVTMRRELIIPVSVTLVLDCLVDELPSDVAITGLELDAQRPDPAPIERKGANDMPVRNPTELTTVPEPVVDMLVIRLHGHGPDDMAVGRFVSALNQNPLFTDVAFRASRSEQRDGLMTKEFSLEIQVDLQREFRVAATEVTHVD